MADAIENAKKQGFEKAALVEEFATGQEYSVEYVSWQGKHIFLALTHKYTTGAPHFIETGHYEPAGVDMVTLQKVQTVVEHALTSLGIEYGASHTELKISKQGDIKLIEIGGRMGGDFIGSDLVKLSTGVDFVEKVIEIALGIEPVVQKKCERAAGVHFIFGQEDIETLNQLKCEHPEYLVAEEVHEVTDEQVVDSSARFGYFLISADSVEDLMRYLPDKVEEE